MKKGNIYKKTLVAVLSTVMTLGAVSTAWAGNVYGDDGSHIKIMTSAGESTSLPKTEFNGANISLLPAGSEIWVSSEGSTAGPSTIFFYLGVCPTYLLTDYEHVTDTNLYAKAIYAEDLEIFDKKYSAISEYYGANEAVYVAIFQDNEDTSWQRFFYILDDGSHPVIPAETKAETESGWKQDNTGWWYQNADGSYPKSVWQQIDSKYYYFNESGYMLSNTTTPDGYQVDESGAWIQETTAEKDNATSGNDGTTSRHIGFANIG